MLYSKPPICDQVLRLAPDDKSSGYRPQSLLTIAAGVILLLSTFVPAYAQSSTNILDQVGFVQKLNQQIPLDLAFRDAAEQPVQIGDYFGARPVILVIGYYNCPNLCDMVRQG